MSFNRFTHSPAALEASEKTAAAESPGPSITQYQKIAAGLIAAIDQLASTMPDLEVEHASNAEFVRRRQNVPMEFLATVIAAVEQSPELQRLNKLDLNAARDTMQFLEAFRPVVDKAVAFVRNVKFTLFTKKASLGLSCLQVYDVAKGLVRDPGSAALEFLVENMRRDLNRQGRNAAEKAPATPGLGIPARALLLPAKEDA